MYCFLALCTLFTVPLPAVGPVKTPHAEPLQLFIDRVQNCNLDLKGISWNLYKLKTVVFHIFCHTYMLSQSRRLVLNVARVSGSVYASQKLKLPPGSV